MKNRKLFLDIETSANKVYTFGWYEQTPFEYVEPWYILCASWRWEGEKTIHAVAQIDFPNYEKNRRNDKNVVLKLWQLLDEADIVVAHNGDKFDLKKINARIIEQGLTPPSPYKTVDTLKVSRRMFGFDTHKLTDTARRLSIGVKEDTGGYKLWINCMDGDSSAWKKMVKYNKHDVYLLERVYEKFLPWIPNHPFIGNREEECPNCGSHHYQSRNNEIRKGGKKVKRFQCQECGKWFYGKKQKEEVVNI